MMLSSMFSLTSDDLGSFVVGFKCTFRDFCTLSGAACSQLMIRAVVAGCDAITIS